MHLIPLYKNLMLHILDTYLYKIYYFSIYTWKFISGVNKSMHFQEER